MTDKVITEKRWKGRLEITDYHSLPTEDDAAKIAFLVEVMDYWKGWVGPPVTIFDPDHQDGGHDANHRVRAVRYLATVRRLQILIPIRFHPDRPETAL